MNKALLGLLAAGILTAPLRAQAVIVGDLEQIAPVPTVYTTGVDTGVFLFSALADVTAPVQAVDVMLGLGNTTTSGCEAADFAGFVPGSIALIQRSGCLFELTAENAAAAGAVGVLIFNQGNNDSRLGLIIGTLGPGYTGGIPVMGLPYALGAEFSMTPGLIMHMFVRDEVAVSEPGTLALIGFGLAGLGFSRRRRAA
jgi:Zn-dependent M28 family amino/carboxypeptidase